MANNYLTPTVIAKEALRRLKNNLVMARLVNRNYEDKFGDIGETITIPKPIRYQVTTGKTLNRQDVVEGSTTLSVDTQKHVAFGFDSKALTLDPVSFGEKFIEPAVSQLAHDVDQDLLSLYKDVPAWAGTPGQTIDSYADFAKAPERLDLIGVPADQRYAVLHPTDAWALLGSQTNLNATEKIAETAYRKAMLGNIAGVETFKTQQIRTHIRGTVTGGTPLTDGNATVNMPTSYSATKDNAFFQFTTDGWGTTLTLKKGDVFTIEDVYDVNPNTKDALPHLKQFTVYEDVTTNASGSSDTLVKAYPVPISSGAHQNVSTDVIDGKAITVMGSASGQYRQNMVFHKNAFTLAVRPLVIDPSMSFAARATDKDTGLSVRIIRDYDATNDDIVTRLDILYGKKATYPELACRLSGTA